MLKNLTPHAITVRPEMLSWACRCGVLSGNVEHCDDCGAARPVVAQTFQPSGIVPRVAVSAAPCGDCDGLPLVTTRFGTVEGLPDAEEGTWLVVSAIVLGALAGTRPDCVAPDTSPASAIRNDAGQIIAVRRLTR